MSAHALAIALDDYLSLTDNPTHTRAVEALVRLREEASREVDRLIALLDWIEGDPDLEPSLGATTVSCIPHRGLGPRYDTSQENWGASSTDDTEIEHDGREPDEHTHGFEPNFATTEAEDRGHYAPTGGLWLASQRDDCEAEDEHGGDILDQPHDEPNGVDDEVSWPESAGAGPRGMTTWNVSDDDEDGDPAHGMEDDNGLADQEGLDEQGYGHHAELLHRLQAQMMLAAHEAECRP
jgi:hypothetical protein